jgi:hypothetical protein
LLIERFNIRNVARLSRGWAKDDRMEHCWVRTKKINQTDIT